MKQTLKNKEKPTSAPTDIQYQYSFTSRPLDLRRANPIVDAFMVASLLTYDRKTEPTLHVSYQGELVTTITPSSNKDNCTNIIIM